MATKPPVESKIDLSLVSSSVADLLGLSATQTERKAGAEAQDFTASGYQAEADAYTTQAAIARRNAELEGISGDIRALQAKREVGKAVGTQRAAIAGAGYKESGTAVAQLRNSLQEGYLSEQLIRTQTGITQGGLLEEAASAEGLSAAAVAASQSAQLTAQANRDAQQAAAVTSANQTKALSTYLEKYGTDDETALITSVLKGDNPDAQLQQITKGLDEGLVEETPKVSPFAGSALSSPLGGDILGDTRRQIESSRITPGVV